jgi:hypothetical protein
MAFDSYITPQMAQISHYRTFGGNQANQQTYKCFYNRIIASDHYKSVKNGLRFCNYSSQKCRYWMDHNNSIMIDATECEIVA